MLKILEVNENSLEGSLCQWEVLHTVLVNHSRVIESIHKGCIRGRHLLLSVRNILDIILTSVWVGFVFFQLLQSLLLLLTQFCSIRIEHRGVVGKTVRHHTIIHQRISLSNFIIKTAQHRLITSSPIICQFTFAPFPLEFVLTSTHRSRIVEIPQTALLITCTHLILSRLWLVWTIILCTATRRFHLLALFLALLLLQFLNDSVNLFQHLRGVHPCQFL